MTLRLKNLKYKPRVVSIIIMCVPANNVNCSEKYDSMHIMFTMIIVVLIIKIVFRYWLKKYDNIVTIQVV